MARKIVWSTGLALVLASCVLLPLLGHKLLTDWDEGIYAEVSREMLGGGWRAWIVPHWNGQLWFEKPPLTLWITAAFFRVFGVTEFWARAGSALSGVTLVGVLHRWMARHTGLLAAWTGTVILLSTPGFLHLCHTGETDALLSLGCVVALLGLAAVCSGQPRGWFGFWCGFATAAMTKGSASIVLPLTVLCITVVERWGMRQYRRSFWWGLVLFIALALPWHLAMWHMFGVAFAREYFGFHVIARATQVIEGHSTPWWYYAEVLLVSAMPWVLVFPFAAWRAFYRADLRVFAVFAIVVAVFFSAVKTRLPHYVAPMYPAMAAVVATFLVNEGRRVRAWPMRRQIAVAAVAAVVWSGGLLLTAGGRKRLHSASGTGGWTAAEEREAVELLCAARNEPVSGPVLAWWTEPRRSVATSVFYSRQIVVQVRPERGDPLASRERYTSDVRRLDEAVGERPLILLLETKLVPALPKDFLYSRSQAGPTMEFCLIRRRSPNPGGK